MSNRQWGFVARKKQHQSDINRLVKDIRLSPNRAALLKMVSILLDAETPEVQKFFMLLIAAQFIDPRGYRWKDTEDAPGVEVPSKVDLEAAKTITSALAFLREG